MRGGCRQRAQRRRETAEGDATERPPAAAGPPKTPAAAAPVATAASGQGHQAALIALHDCDNQIQEDRVPKCTYVGVDVKQLAQQLAVGRTGVV